MSFELNNETTIEREIPALEFTDGHYVVRFARTPEEIDAALRLRFEVFNLELGEGLATSFINGRDEDEFDKICHHLIVIEKNTNSVIGTYRLQTLEMAQSVSGFYCSGEFKTEDLPAAVLNESLEIGRACIDIEHRNSRVLFLLWRGLIAYCILQKKRYLFGCCSLTLQDETEGWKAMRNIEQNGFLHRKLFIAPRAEYVCDAESFPDKIIDKDWHLPKLFLTYMRFGAKVCSPPAIDREFKTIDFFVMFDFQAIDEKFRRMFLA